MAKDAKAKPEDKKTEEKAAPQPVAEKIKKTLINWENIQNLAIILAMVMGIRQPPKPGDPSRSGEKQIPNWILSAFPSLTDEDEVEYNLGLSSHSDLSTRITAEEFEENLKKEGVYDEVVYRVRLVKVRREFLEKVKNPATENKNTVLTFSPLNISDAMIEFMDRLFIEKNSGGTSEEIFEKQKKVAENRKLLQKKHFLKRFSEKIQKKKLFLLLNTLIVIFSLIYLFSIIFA